jgi:hypothetical protein
MRVPDLHRSRYKAKTLFHALAALLLAVAALLIAAPTASSDPNPDAALEKSVLLLETKWTGFIYVPAYATSDGQAFYTKELTYYTTCTGWYVSKTAQIVTAGHCVDPAKGREVLIRQFLQHAQAADRIPDALTNWHVEGATQNSPVDRTVQAIQPQSVEGATVSSATTVQIVDFQPFDKGDVALLKVPNMSKETPALIVASTTPQVGEPLTSIGFPGDVRSIADQSQIARASFKTGSVSSQQVSPEGVTQIEVNTEIGGGMSGGPTVNKDGRVVGVNSSGLQNGGNFNFITNTDDLRTFLMSHNVELVQPPAPKSGMNLLWYAIGGGGVVLVLGVATAFLLIRRRRNGQPAMASATPLVPSGPSQAPMPGPSPSQPPLTHSGASASAAAATETPQVGVGLTDVANRPPVTASPPETATLNGIVQRTGGGNGYPQTTEVIPNAVSVINRYCSNCGAERHHNEQFCPQCGHHMT